MLLLAASRTPPKRRRLLVLLAQQCDDWQIYFRDQFQRGIVGEELDQAVPVPRTERDGTDIEFVGHIENGGNDIPSIGRVIVGPRDDGSNRRVGCLRDIAGLLDG